MRRRLVLAAVSLATAWTMAASAPVAADAPRTEASPTSSGASVAVSSEGSNSPSPAAGSGSGRPPSTVRCTDHDLLTAGFLDGLGGFFGGAIDSATSSSVAWRVCTDEATGATTTSLTGLLAPPAGAAPSPPPAAIVAAMAEAELQLELPDVRTAPPRAGLQLAGVRVWFWTDSMSRSATASIPGLSATVTAQPAGLTVSSPGAGTSSCEGGGLAHPSPPAEACTLLFPRRGRHPVDATLRWTLRWTASDGSSGTLPDVTRTSTFPLLVSDGIALTD